jgi:hypothetical protein
MIALSQIWSVNRARASMSNTMPTINKNAEPKSNMSHLPLLGAQRFLVDELNMVESSCG